MLTATDKKNAFWNSSVFIYSQLMGFISYSINLKTYGFDLFGFYLLVAAVFGIGSSLDLGFGISTIKGISEANKKCDTILLNSIFVSFFAIFFVLGLVISLALLAYYYLFFCNIDVVKSHANYSLGLIYFFLTISFFLNYLSAYLRSVFEGFASYALLGKLTFFLSSFNTLLMILLFIFSLELKYLSLFIFLNSIISFVVLFYFSVKLSNLHFSLKHFHFKLIKEYSSYSFNLQLTFFIGSFVDLIMKYIIGGMLSYSYVSYFESSKRIINMTNGLIVSAQRGLFNRLSEENVQGSLKEYVHTSLFTFSKIANSYSAVLYGVLNPIICLFIFFWFKSYESVIIFLLLAIPYCIVNYGGALYSVLMIEGKGFRLPLIQLINVISVGLFLYLSLSISGNYLGILGFWFACIINITLIFYFLNKSQSLNYKLYFKDSNTVLIINLSAILVTQFLMMYFVREYFYLELVIFSAIYAFVFFKQAKWFFNVLFERFKIFKLNFVKRNST